MSGHDLVRQLEQLPVDRNFRPLQDAVIIKCGELVRQIKGKNLKRFIIYIIHAKRIASNIIYKN